jgi:hypothetical protein
MDDSDDNEQQGSDGFGDDSSADNFDDDDDDDGHMSNNNDDDDAMFTTSHDIEVTQLRRRWAERERVLRADRDRAQAAVTAAKRRGLTDATAAATKAAAEQAAAAGLVVVTTSDAKKATKVGGRCYLRWFNPAAGQMQIFTAEQASRVLMNHLIELVYAPADWGLTAQAIDDNIYSWSVRLHSFDPSRCLD